MWTTATDNGHNEQMNSGEPETKAECGQLPKV